MVDPNYLLESFNYHLPESLIAQTPAKERDGSRLLHLERSNGFIQHLKFNEICEFFSPEDLLVLNNSKVFPARLKGHKESGGKVELFLLHLPVIDEENGQKAKVRALMKSSKPPGPGQKIIFSDSFHAVIEERHETGQVEAALFFKNDLSSTLQSYGSVPLPPYIRRGDTDQDRSRYQTVYACQTGSVAAPTAGLHFTKNILDQLKNMGIKIVFITLHVGYGTFAPLREQDIREHKIHEEFITVSRETAEAINLCKDRGGRIVAAGTTTVRAMEFCSSVKGIVKSFSGPCDLYITPGYEFRVVDRMITNFHLPCSSLLVLVSAFYERETILETYKEAVREKYRFYSYGDAMLIT